MYQNLPLGADATAVNEDKQGYSLYRNLVFYGFLLLCELLTTRNSCSVSGLE